jgi:hypothetical protein
MTAEVELIRISGDAGPDAGLLRGRGNSKQDSGEERDCDQSVSNHEHSSALEEALPL